MRQIKVQIQRFRVIGINWTRGGDWGRYNNVESMIFTPGIDFVTEAELMKYIYQKYGEGRYKIVAWMKGNEGFFLYWLGNLYENGFVRDKSKNKEMDRLKKELARAKDHEERKMVEEDMDFERELSKDFKDTSKKQGPVGLIRYTSGMMHAYDELPPMKRNQPTPDYIETGNPKEKKAKITQKSIYNQQWKERQEQQDRELEMRRNS